MIELQTRKLQTGRLGVGGLSVIVFPTKSDSSGHV